MIKSRTSVFLEFKKGGAKKSEYSALKVRLKVDRPENESLLSRREEEVEMAVCSQGSPEYMLIYQESQDFLSQYQSLFSQLQKLQVSKLKEQFSESQGVDDQIGTNTRQAADMMNRCETNVK